MKQYNYFFGVDISKKTVDIALLHLQQITHQKFANDNVGVKELSQWLKNLNIVVNETIFCMEATGLYCFTLTNFLAINTIDI